jgi:hypothetical protein
VPMLLESVADRELRERNEADVLARNEILPEFVEEDAPGNFNASSLEIGICGYRHSSYGCSLTHENSRE